MKHCFLPALISILFLLGCSNSTESTTTTAPDAATPAGQSGVQDDESAKDVVKIAAGSKDHTTLVAALQAAGYVDALSNAGPFTVFAPTNAAFDKLPKGTVEDLLKPANKDKLRDILEYHVYVGVLKDALMSDGLTYGMASGKSITIGNKDGQLSVNGINILATIPASNGIIYVTDGVLLPPQ
ncbi:MAG TPA: fasciclin domain-containing protein [Lacibacter sp.]|nr:fasciclin domain-containing protein [Lacibacter sp.]HMO89277.1 fasciclin domain-containing protein [Lacibacter sp.]HMP87852.1 fasciclin domain-containing protein [Lacibacter sp.]